MIVVKFGGTSLAGTERMRAAARIVAAQRRDQVDNEVVCVVSAMAGVTDALIRAIEIALTGEMTTSQAIMQALRIRHIETAQGLTTTATTTATIPAIIPSIPSIIEATWEALEADLAGLVERRFSSDAARAHALAAFSGWGERLSVQLFSLALAAEGVVAAPYTGEPVVMALRRSGEADAGGNERDADTPWERYAPSVAATRALLAEPLRAQLAAGATPALPGYLARTASGQLTTLGRNGSDTSAATVAAALGADALYIYSDVTGVHRADPRVVPEATALPRLTYADAAEIAALGARVLHPPTLRPLAAAGIPLRLRSSFQPEAPGTDIGSPAQLGLEPGRLEQWVVVATPLSPQSALFEKEAPDATGLVEVTGFFLRHADLVAREDDYLTYTPANEPAADSPGDGPVSGALALLSDAPRPLGLTLSARRISVAVPASASAATQRRLYAALAHADERARRQGGVSTDDQRQRAGDALAFEERRRSS